MAKNLTDLTARTATADSDLIHVNSGGTDYKETKANFLRGDFDHLFANDTLLTTQVDALPGHCTVFGYANSYGHKTEMGLPINAAVYVIVRSWSTNNRMIEVFSVTNPEDSSYRLYKANGTWGSEWVHMPYRAEITSLNNSLTNNSMTPMSVLSDRGTALGGGYCLVGNMVHINWKFKAGQSATNSPSISSTPPSPKTEAALSCIDITSGISSAIDGSVPCGVSSVGTLFLKEIVNNHIYAITGTYIKL